MKRFAIAASVGGALALSSTVLAAAALSGTYKTKVTSSALGGQLKGTWTIKLKSPNYTITDTGTVVVRGKYSIKGTRITFKDKSGPAACSGAAVYSYALTANQLHFTKVKDSSASCPGRAVVLAGTFTKIG